MRGQLARPMVVLVYGPVLAAGWLRVCSTEFVEEGGDVAGEQLGFLDRGKVAAAGHGRPPADVVKTFRPFAGRVAIVDVLVREDSDPGRHRHNVRRPHLRREPPVVYIVPPRGRDRLGGPVQGHDSEQEITGEGGVQVTAGGGPCPPLLQYPASQAGRRAVEPVPGRLRPDRLDL